VEELSPRFELDASRRSFRLAGSSKSIALRPGMVEASLPGSQGTGQIRLRFGTNRLPAVPQGIDPQAAESFYYVGKGPAEWRPHVRHYARVRYANVAPGVDVEFYTKDGRLEFDWLLRPGANPDRIAIDVEGADRLDLRPDHGIDICTKGSCVAQHRPVAYQKEDGAVVPVNASYRIDGRRILLSVGSYNAHRDLIIDPVLSWLSHLGGTAADWPSDIKAAPDGGAYLLFTTSSPSLWFPSGDVPVEKPTGYRARSSSGLELPASRSTRRTPGGISRGEASL
jgi:hypothetical protein